MVKIHEISMIGFATFQAKFAMLIGLFLGVVYAVGGLATDLLVSVNLLSSASFHTDGLGIGTLLAFMALLGMPMLFATLGFIIGLFEAALYKAYLRYFQPFNADF